MLRLLKRRWPWILLAAVLVAMAGFLAWALLIPSPMPQALEALQSNAQVAVQSGRWLVFEPTGQRPDAGLVLYPGGRVDYRAYAAVGGHSLGGAMAASYARKQPDKVQGLVLWAAYPSGSDDLSGHGLQVVSIYATRDGLTTGANIEASRRLLPSSTRWVAIEGGNHAQFGWYGAQSGDQEATISREEQQAQIVTATVDLLRSLSGERMNVE
jgi:dienelactone hydrolase